MPPTDPGRAVPEANLANATETTEWSPALSAVLPPSARQSLAEPTTSRTAALPTAGDQASPHNLPEIGAKTATNQRGGLRETVGPIRADRKDGKPDGIFYGWVIVAATFLIMAVSSGLGFYNVSVILAAATKELDASVGAVSGATALFFALSGIIGYAFSKQMDSVDLRWFFAIGGLVGATALGGLQWVDSVIELYIFFAVFSVGFALAGLIPATTVVTRWFDRRRSVALSIASTGLSVGGIVITPIAALLIDRTQLAGASPYLAAMWVVGIVPVAVILIRSRPSEMGLAPDGEPPQVTPTAAPADQTAPYRAGRTTTDQDPGGLDFATARSTRFFIALCIANTAISFGQVGAIVQLFNMVEERTDNGSAKIAIMVLAASSIAARLAGGALVLRFETRTFNAVLAVLQAVSLVLLATSDSSITLILTSALFGVSVGNLLMLQPLLMAEAFGVRNYGRIFGLSQLFVTIGIAGGPLVLGVLRDSFDYRLAFFVAGGTSLLGFLFITLAGPTGRVRDLWLRGPALLPTD